MENVYAVGTTKIPPYEDLPNIYGKSYDSTFNSIVEIDNIYYEDTIITKLGNNLTVLAQTLLGSEYRDMGEKIALDSYGNIYVSGTVSDHDNDIAPNFPVTEGAYDTTFNRESYQKNGITKDIFVSKLNNYLTDLLASTLLGSVKMDSLSSMVIGSDEILITGSAGARDFPLLTSIQGEVSSENFANTTYISKFNSDLTNLMESTSIGNRDATFAAKDITTIDNNPCIAGFTQSPDLIGVTDTYDSSFNGSDDCYILKTDFSGTSTEPAASVTTGDATNITAVSATLNGVIDSHKTTLTYWFEYGITNDSYPYTSVSQTITSNDATDINAEINNLTMDITYYYRLAAQNLSGVTYGDEKSFHTLPSTITPTPTSIPLTPIPTPTLGKGSISGNVLDKFGNPIESAKLRLKGTNSKILRKTISDEDGLFEFTDLDADTYSITAIKKGYKIAKQTITLEAGEERDIEIVMKKTKRK